MKVLTVGQGAREHALLYKLSRSGKVKKLFCAPGNGGTSDIAQNVPLRPADTEGIADFCVKEKIDFVVIGPEAPLEAGLADLLQKEKIPAFGPAKNAAILESSKIFTKELCREESIPTADFEIFNRPNEAKKYIETRKTPLVVKADGLAQGKGVIVAQTHAEAREAVDSIMIKRAFGKSGERVIIEEFLEGEEASIIVVSDGSDFLALKSSQDHKRAFEGDRGPNTGGMGAYSPAPVVTGRIFEDTLNSIIRPAIAGMKKRGRPFKGALYAGIMIKDSRPSLLEFNVRFGDPETQAILPLLESDIFDILTASAGGGIKKCELKWSRETAVAVVLASGGYPGEYEKGKEIKGLARASADEGIVIFHAGTKKEGGKYFTDGGRVLSVVAKGENTAEAAGRAYEACSKINFDGMHYRKDIAKRAIKPDSGKKEKIC